MELKIVPFSQKMTYTGNQIHPLWALHQFGVAGDSVIIFRGPMNIPREEMIDIRDIIREKDLAEILISSDDCIHFIIEMFDDQPANLKMAYHRLHILCLLAKKVIEKEYTIALTKNGTDLFYQKKKLNVAIATSSNNSSKIHFGLNIISSGVPKHVQAIGLKEINDNIELVAVAKKIAEKFIVELQAIMDDITKSRTF